MAANLTDDERVGAAVMLLLFLLWLLMFGTVHPVS
jgi:hypothetical protein